MRKNKPLHISVGNLNIDISMYVQSFPGPDESVIADDALISCGGSATNYAVAVTYYGHRATLIASTSRISFIDYLLEDLEKIGVDTSYIKRVQGPPGIVSVIVSSSGEKIMIKHRGANEFLSPNDIPRQLISRANIVHLASVPPSIAVEVARRASGLGILVSYDPGNYALSNPEEVREAIPYLSILFVNRREAKALGGSNIDKIAKLGPQYIVVKKGPGGAFVITPGGLIYYGVTKPIRPPIDSTGAGDAFDAFFNAALLDSKDPGKALMYAIAAGALKTTCRGSRLCYDKTLFNKQLSETSVEALKNPEEWIIED